MSDSAAILLVEDLEDDVLLVRRSFKKAGIINPFQVVRDGEEAVAYLSGTGRFFNRDEYPIPGLILLDLKLPKMDGFEVLYWLRTQPGIGTIPVIVLTSSDQIRDANRAYTLGANSVMVKPMEFENHVHLSQLIRLYWLKAVKLPEVSRPPPVQSDKQAPP